MVTNCERDGNSIQNEVHRDTIHVHYGTGSRSGRGYEANVLMKDVDIR